MLRDIAEGIAEEIREDEYLRENGRVTVVVEDKADVYAEVQAALGGLGVLVLISVTGFVREDNSPLPQGDIEFQISCFENPTLNREGEGTLTAQGVAEYLCKALHYAQFPFLVGQMIFKDMGRDDVDEANIVRSNYKAHTRLGYEDDYFNPSSDSTGEDKQETQE